MADIKSLNGYNLKDAVAREQIADLQEAIDNIDFPEQVNADWNVNDETSPAYIQNRPFYMEDGVVFNGEVSIDGGYGFIDSVIDLVEGETFSVEWDGVEYNNLVCYHTEPWTGSPRLHIGNPNVISNAGGLGDTSVPFAICFNPNVDNSNVYTSSDGTYDGTHTFTVFGLTPVKLDSKFLDGSLILSGTGTGAEVFNTPNNTASGNQSHAEGWCTTASGEWSHAEGAYTFAEGFVSHAEGRSCQANGDYSHAEGINTIAASRSQHVQGECNIVDSDGRYLHIVGNGDVNNLSNAHTLDWDGNGWYAGSLFVGGTSQDDAEEVATKSYADSVASSAAAAVKNDLLNGAGEAYDTLKELGDLIDDNHNAIEVLEDVATNKADKEHTHTVSDITDMPEVVNADWNDNDPTSAAYVKNRTHWIDDPFEDEVLFESENVEGEEVEIDRIYLFEGEEYRVVFDDVEYTRFAYVEDDLLVLGYQDEDPFFIMGEAIENEDSGAPMSLDRSVAGEYSYIYTYTEGSHSIKISHIIREVHKISEEFLPNGAMVGEIVDENHGEIFNDYEHNVAIGEYSHAEGYSTKAYGNYSHAEGLSTQADGYYSHAEGYGSKANKTASHAEGYDTTANGYASHAEGYNTTANGSSSHAEGRYTTANGDYSHAEGYRTIASSDYQHVQGMFNIEDVDNTYAHIVGNGENDYSRSNVHTLDWDGNAWFAGTIKLGGTSYDDASEIALKSDLDSIGIISDEEIDAIFASI